MCQLLRALDGLKQSPREWYFTLRDFLISQGYEHTESDHSLFVNKQIPLMVSAYVDDIGILGPKGSKHISERKRDLHVRFPMTDLGPIHILYVWKSGETETTGLCDSHKQPT